MLESIALSDLACSVGGRLHHCPPGADVYLSGLSIDSRTAEPGDLFVAIPGERVDGHEYIAAAADNGAAAAMVLRQSDVPLPQVVVGDIEQSLATLGGMIREPYRGVLVAITGSAGKTTCKNLMASVLSQAGNVVATRGNRNNELGVPISLATLKPETEFAVLEMGAGKPGDIAWLMAMARPTIGVLLNIAPAHLEHFGSLDAIAATKGAIVEGLPDKGLAVINGDEPWTDEWKARAGSARVLTFGMSTDTDVSARDIELLGFRGSCFTLVSAEDSFSVNLALPGRQGVANALAAAAVGLALGLSSEAIARGLAAVEPESGRGRVHSLPGDVSLVDDTYNANPLAVKAAIEVLAGCEGRRRLVLGGMLELGETSDQLHLDCGRYARESGIDELWVIGPAARAAAEGFGPGARYFDSRDELLAEGLGMAPGGTVLVKASRGIALDRVVEGWLAQEGGEVC